MAQKETIKGEEPKEESFDALELIKSKKGSAFNEGTKEKGKPNELFIHNISILIADFAYIASSM